MIPWIVGLVIGVALLGAAIWLVVRNLGSDGGGAIQVGGVSVNTGSTAALALIFGFGLVVFSLWRLDEQRGEPGVRPSVVSTGSSKPAGRSDTPAKPRPLAPASIGAALNRGITAAHGFGGKAQAAVWVEGAEKPVVRGNFLSERMRPWSMVRVATTIAAYRAATAPGLAGPLAMLTEAIRRTVIRAENCAHFRVVLGLQELAGGRNAARAGVANVFDQAGAGTFEVADKEGPPDRDCKRDPMSLSGFRDPLGVGVLFGTSSWTIHDAIYFAHALGIGTFREAGRFVMDLMRAPKLENRDPGAARQYTAPLDWGAGRVLAQWNPAYKAGWGGASISAIRYLAGQIAVVEVAGRSVAIAVVFHPAIEPSSDDPGAANVIEPVEAVLSELAHQFAAA